MATSFIIVDDITVGESDAYADFLVRLDTPNTGVVTVNYTTFNSTADVFDYDGQGGTLTFAPGETVKTVRVTLKNDANIESSQNFGFQLYSPSANAALARNLATATIIDNDATAGTPVVTINDFVIDEAAKEANFVITLNKPSTSVVSINYATQNGAAVAGSDFVATSGTLNFAPGETAKTVKVTLLNDTISEISEAFNLVLSNLTNATTQDPIGTVIINENDGTTVAKSNIIVDDITVGESDAYADFLVRLDAPNTGVVTVNYTTFNSTADVFDYDGQGGTLTFAPGETVKTVRVTLKNDANIESSQNFGFQLYSPSANAALARNLATATIIDNDATAGTPVVSLGDAVVDENNGLVYVTATLDKPSTSGVKVNYSIQNVTTTSGTDFVSFPNQTVSFGVGETAKTIVVGVLDDTISEASEIFDVAVTSVSGATIGDGRGHVVIGSNDATSVATSTLSVANVAAVESNGYTDFLVRLDAPNTSLVTVNYGIFNSTADGFDYDGQSGFLTFVPGETVKTVRVTLINDTTAESSENFGFQLYSPSANAVLGNTTATATIIDNDSARPVSLINITGTTGSDILRGTRFADLLVGGSGNDVLDGAGGNDSMEGGSGNDLYIVEQTGDAIAEAVNGGNDKVVSYVNYTLAANVENLLLFGSALTGTGNSLNNTITGNASNNTLNGSTGADTMTGGAGNDIYILDNVGDVVIELANGGTDTVQSSVNYILPTQVENLTLTGSAAINGTGNSLANRISGNAANNVLDGSTGTDTISYSNATAAVTVNLAIAIAQNTVGAGTDTLLNFENLTGSNFADNLRGNANANILNGGTGADTLAGGAGNDTYVVDNFSDVIIENLNEGTDTVQSSVTFSFAAFPNLENLTLTGTGNINGTGNAANNVIIGNSGNNTLNSGAGNDLLTGASGKDAIAGGAGSDKFVYKNLTDSLLANFDVVTDFNATAGNDLFSVTTARAGFTNAGAVATLDADGISAKLTTANFGTNFAAQFTFGSRTFVAINNSTAGFNVTNDAIIEVTGLTGTLSTANFVTV
ncbi:hypothetical protein LC593_04385 [Nostoc sp. CHAB 5844]|nr:hypothetical protein [Nostoc sp. CHAB 5844]